MGEKTIESASAELISTLNEAIKSGVENMPVGAQTALDALHTYYIASLTTGVFWMVLSIGLVALCAWGFKKGIAMDMDNDNNAVAPFVIALSIVAWIVSAFGIVMSALQISSSFAGAISPLGKILVRYL